MDAMPGRRQGPKINQRMIPCPTKLSPRPAKISFTPPFVFKTPATTAHIAPPKMPAISDNPIKIVGMLLAASSRRTAVVKTAPSMI